MMRPIQVFINVNSNVFVASNMFKDVIVNAKDDVIIGDLLFSN